MQSMTHVLIRVRMSTLLFVLYYLLQNYDQCLRFFIYPTFNTSYLNMLEIFDGKSKII